MIYHASIRTCAILPSAARVHNPRAHLHMTCTRCARTNATSPFAALRPTRTHPPSSTQQHLQIGGLSSATLAKGFSKRTLISYTSETPPHIPPRPECTAATSRRHRLPTSRENPRAFRQHRALRDQSSHMHRPKPCRITTRLTAHPSSSHMHRLQPCRNTILTVIAHAPASAVPQRYRQTPSPSALTSAPHLHALPPRVLAPASAPALHPPRTFASHPQTAHSPPPLPFGNCRLHTAHTNQTVPTGNFFLLPSGHHQPHGTSHLTIQAPTPAMPTHDSPHGTSKIRVVCGWKSPCTQTRN